MVKRRERGKRRILRNVRMFHDDLTEICRVFFNVVIPPIQHIATK